MFSKVLLVAPSPPPYGGMALQARLLHELLLKDGISATLFSSNFPLPRAFRVCERIRGLRAAVRFWMTWPKLWRAIRQTEVVHVFAASWLYFFLVVWPAVLVGKLCRRRVILNYRGGEAPKFFEQYGLLARPVFKLADVVTAPSRFLADVIGLHFTVSVAIVPNILDLSAFQYRQRGKLQPKLLVTRHLEQIYDVETVIRAFRVIQERYPDASLWIAGTGSEEGRLRGLVGEWGLRNVRFLGHVPHEDLPAISSQCAVLVNASRIDNFPGALLEGSAAGLVVVSTNAGGIPYIYEDGKDAVLIGLGDPQQLARAVQKVLDHPSLSNQLIQAGLALAQNFEWAQVRRSLYAVYGLALEEQKTSGEVKCVAG